MADSDIRLLVFGCVHQPFTSKKAVQFLRDRIEVSRPNLVVCLGDLVDMTAAGKFQSETARDLEEEFYAAASFLNGVRTQALEASDCGFVYVRGNHCHRAEKEGRIPKHFRSMCRPSNHVTLGPELQNWEITDYRNDKRGVVWVRNKIGLQHGFSCGVNSDRDEAVRFSMMFKRLDTLMIRAHTHRPLPVTRVRLTAKNPLPIYYANCGTLGPLNPEWANENDTSEWAHAVVEVVVKKGGKWRAQTVLAGDDTPAL